MEAEGLIGFIKPRQVAGGYTTYSFTFDDREDGRWFGTYKLEPPEVGTYVKFEYTTNSAGFHNVENKTLTTVEKEGAPAADDAPVTGRLAKTQGAYKGATNRDANINWQSARNAAIALCQVASDAGALDLGTGKKDSKIEALLLIANRLTVDYFDQAMEVNNTGERPEEFRG